MDGPEIAKIVYRELFKSTVLDPDTIPYALDAAVQALRKKPEGVGAARWACYIHTGI